MTNDAADTSDNEGATVVITHKVKNNKHAEYDHWLTKIAPLCKAAKGHLDWSIVRPIAGLSATYTVIIRFDNTANLKAWMESSDRNNLIDEVEPLLAKGDDFFISNGLDFWFTPAGAKAKIPVRWKQFLVTWSAIYPLALGVPLAVAPAFNALGLRSVALSTLIVTGVVVFLMVYIVMPRYTRLVQHWLFQRIEFVT